MMMTIQSYMRSFLRTLRRLWTDQRVRTLLRVGAYVLCGYFLSAASLRGQPLPLSLALLCASAGWPSVCIALGGVLGYWSFWNDAAAQGVVWLAGGMIAVLFLGDRPITKTAPLLRPAVAALIVALTGLAYQLWMNDTTSVAMYLLRILLAGAGTRVFDLAAQRRDPVADWLAWGLGTLALAQVMPMPYVGLGYIVAGALAVSGAFPAAALAGLALDLAQVTEIPMTAVVCITYFIRLVPRHRRWMIHAAPGLMYVGVMALCGMWDIYPLPGLILGGIGAYFIPGQGKLAHRRGETGVAQVRLEMVANAFSQAQQLLLEAQEGGIDERALLLRTAERACGSCPCRKGCKEREQVERMDTQVLHSQLLDSRDLPFACRKSGRLLSELLRTQEQLRAIGADRQRRREYRNALVQQYRFLCDYLQELSDTLGRRVNLTVARYKPLVAFCANRREADNGDRCRCFAGVGCRYYVLLCDGMGTGL